MLENKRKLSVVVPLLNEEENVVLLYQKLRQALRNQFLLYEIIFVDDGSTDGTYQLLKKLKSSDDKIIIVKFVRNFGQSAAFAAGFNIASGDLAITLDGDIQYDPEDIAQFLGKVREEGVDIVCGWRQADSLFMLIRRCPSIIANFIGSILFGLEIHDFSCSFRAYRKNCYKSLFLGENLHRFIPIIAKFNGMVIREVRVRILPRRRGLSKYSALRFPRVIKDALLLKISELFFRKSYEHLFKGADFIIDTILY